MGGFLEFYRRHFGGVDSPGQIYSGFTLFFAGVAFGLVGILVILFGDALLADIRQQRELGIVLAALGFPVLLVGIHLTLPSKRLAWVAAGIGGLVCIVGVFLFSTVFPDDWNKPSDLAPTTQTIGTYAVGLVLLFATTAMALVTNFIARHTPTGQAQEGFTPWDSTRPVSEEEVLRDIERETARQKLSWGGVRERDVSADIELRLKDSFEGPVVIGGLKGARVVEVKDPMHETSFESLLAMRGRDRFTKSEEDATSGSVKALAALRKARRAEAESSWWFRFKRWLRQAFRGESPAGGAGGRPKQVQKGGPGAPGPKPVEALPEAQAGATRAEVQVRKSSRLKKE